MAPLFEHYSIQLWTPEVGGRIDFHAKDHQETMLARGLGSTCDRTACIFTHYSLCKERSHSGLPLRRRPWQVPRDAAAAVTGSRRLPGRLACPARYDRRMAYDEDLAARIRDLIGLDPELTEKKLFGGLAFLIRGHMAISASDQGGAPVHVDSERSAGLLAASGATTAVIQGREMPGWLRVSPEDLASDDDLSRWVEIGIGYARPLPPKQPAKAKLKK
jgi:hypothetical protein